MNILCIRLGFILLLQTFWWTDKTTRTSRSGLSCWCWINCRQIR